VTDWALSSAKLVKGAKLKIVPGGPHGMCSTLKDQINAELLAFFHQARANRKLSVAIRIDSGLPTNRASGFCHVILW
jgi:hypothetical protein